MLNSPILENCLTSLTLILMQFGIWVHPCTKWTGKNISSLPAILSKLRPDVTALD